VQLVSLGAVSAAGIPSANVKVYYNGEFTGGSSIIPGNTVGYGTQGASLLLNVNQAFEGMLLSEQWAKMTLTPPTSLSISPNPPSASNPVISVGQTAVLNATVSGGISPYMGGYDLVMMPNITCSSCSFGVFNGGNLQLNKGMLGLIVKPINNFEVELMTTDPYASPDCTIIVNSSSITPNPQCNELTLLNSGHKIFGVWKFYAEGSDSTPFNITHTANVSLTITPSAGAPTSITTTTTIPAAKAGCNVQSTVYVGGNVTCQQWTVHFAYLGGASAAGIRPAYVNVSYNGALISNSSILPGSTVRYTAQGASLLLNVNQTFYGTLPSQWWAQITLTPVATATISPQQTISLSNSTIYLEQLQGRGIYVYTGSQGLNGYLSTNTNFSSSASVLSNSQGITTWLLNITTYTNSKPGAYTLPLYTYSSGGPIYGSKVYANLTVVISKNSQIPVITLSQNILYLNPGQTGHVYASTAPGDLSPTGALASEGINATVDNGASVPTIVDGFSGYRWYIDVNVSKMTQPGTYTLPLYVSLYPGNYTKLAYDNLTIVVNQNAALPTTLPTTTTIPSYRTYTLTLDQGWNLFSVPLAYAVRINTTRCAPGAISSPVWQFENGVYAEANHIYGGIGYWVRSNSTCAVTFSGPSMAEYAPSLTQGWNLLGAAPSSFGALIPGTCSIERIMGFNTSTNSYYSLNVPSANVSVIPSLGSGYFVEVPAACQLMLGNSNSPPSPP
jgi:hypothetical protein